MLPNEQRINLIRSSNFNPYTKSAISHGSELKASGEREERGQESKPQQRRREVRRTQIRRLATEPVPGRHLAPTL